MKAEDHPFTPNCGFTLLEIIVTLTVASVLGTIIFLYMNTSLTRSTEPVTRIQKTYSLNQIAEQITADYKKLKGINGDYDLATLQTNIQNGNDDSKTPYYGEYSQSTKWLQFDSARDELPGDNGDRILKVAITSNNQTITVLFTK
jgi:prepilin-type N-terminal cleavage/methylation domain-containing protein